MLKQVSAEKAKRASETLKRYKPMPVQARFHRSKAVIRSFRGGNRSGKTTAGAVELGFWALGQHPFLKTPPRPRILAVANDWSMVGDPMWSKLSKPGGVKLDDAGRQSPPIIPERLISDIAWEDRAEEIPKVVTLTTGVKIKFRSCQSGRRKFQGTEEDFIWIDEELEDYSVYEEMRRGMMDTGGRMVWTATPLARARPLVSLHETACMEGKEGFVEEFVASLLDNPHVNPAAKQEFIDELLREHPEYYETRVAGEFLILEGLVYAAYQTRTHEISRADFNAMDPQRIHPRVIAIDPGVSDPFAILWGMLLPGEPREVVFYREFYRKRTNLSEAVRVIKEKSGDEPLLCAIIDPSCKKTDLRGNSLLDDMKREFRKQGLKSSATRDTLPLHMADNAIEAGIYRVGEFMAVRPSGTPGIRVVNDMTNFKREIHRYMYPSEKPNKNINNKPIDKDNHLMDCMRYMLMGLPPYQVLRHKSNSSYSAYDKWRKQYDAKRAPKTMMLGG